jgi:hypothetical protein
MRDTPLKHPYLVLLEELNAKLYDRLFIFLTLFGILIVTMIFRSFTSIKAGKSSHEKL